MRVSLRMILLTRTTKKMGDLLTVFSDHVSTSTSEVLTELAVFACSEAQAIQHASVACYCGTEDIFGMSIIETKNELVQIKRQILSRHIVICPDDSALQQRPKRFDALSV